MKTPPPLEDSLEPAQTRRHVDRDRRFLVFAGLVLVALALGLKSELVAPGSAWWLAAALLAVSIPATLAYLWIEAGSSLPAIEHYVPALLGAFAIAGLSLVVHQWWTWALAAAVFGSGFAVAARLDYLRLADHPKRGHHFIQEAILALALVGGYVALLSAPFPVAMEYGLFAVLLAFLFALSIRPPG